MAVLIRGIIADFRSLGKEAGKGGKEEGNRGHIKPVRTGQGKETVKMKNSNYYEALKSRYITDAMAVNFYADEKDVERNRVNYGSMNAWAQALRDFGHSTDTPVWEDGEGCLRIPYISIDGKRLLEFQNGNGEPEEKQARGEMCTNSTRIE